MGAETQSDGRGERVYRRTELDACIKQNIVYLNTTAWTEQLEGHTMDRSISVRDVKKLVAKLSAISSLGKPLGV